MKFFGQWSKEKITQKEEVERSGSLHFYHDEWNGNEVEFWKSVKSVLLSSNITALQSWVIRER